MLWLKALHVVFMVTWFAALFYLPRLFVNLAMVAADSHAERARLLQAFFQTADWMRNEAG